ncbi:hypothetical protein DFH09DRAFT_1374533 [Mycena vulgaris]|nr:hypothetical protein DFH09DRAFT_1374533 [Mycena vulgaris]
MIDTKSNFERIFSVSESDISELRQNILPDPAVCVALKESIRAAEHRLATLYSLPESPAVSHERQDIERYIAHSSSRLAPVRRLPPELLSKIFSALDSPQIIMGMTLPAPICAVSSYWRAVVMSAPTDFAISLCGGDKTLRILDQHISGSGSASITLRITAPEYIESDTPVNYGILGRLVASSERWVAADIRISHRLLPLFSAIRGRLPALQRLSLHVDPRLPHGEPNPLDDLDIFEIAPKLYRVVLLGMDTIPRLPCPQIHDVRLDPQFLRDLRFSRIGISFPNLRHLSFDGPWTIPTASTPTDIGHLPTLVSCGPVQLYTLSSLSLPALVHLHLRSATWDLPAFSAFLTRSGCSLKSLTIQYYSLHGDDLLALFPLIPTVEALSLLNLQPITLTDAVLRALTPSPGSPPLLPALTSLTLGGSYLFTNTTLLDLLESRTSAPAGLKKLQRVECIIGHREFSAGDVARLRALQGVEVNLNLKHITRRSGTSRYVCQTWPTVTSWDPY